MMNRNDVFVPMFRECSFTTTKGDIIMLLQRNEFSSLCLGNVLSLDIIKSLYKHDGVFGFSSLCLGNVLSLARKV